jgi:hypothetical protein
VAAPTLWDRLVASITAEFDNRSSFAPAGNPDVVFLTDTLINRNVYGQNIIVQSGVTLTVNPGYSLIARDSLINKGTIKPVPLNAFGWGVIGSTYGPGSNATNDNPVTGSGGGTETFGGGTGHSALDVTYANNVIQFVSVYTPDQFFWWAQNLLDFIGLQIADSSNPYDVLIGNGAGGASNGGATGGTGGGMLAPFFIRAPYVNNFDGVIDGRGTPGFAATVTAALPVFQTGHAYTIDQMIQAGSPLHTYRVIVGGTSGGGTPTWTNNGSNVVSGGVTFQDGGIYERAGGGGGGRGIFAGSLVRKWDGPVPLVTGGAGGAGVNGGSTGEAGADGMWLLIYDR